MSEVFEQLPFFGILVVLVSVFLKHLRERDAFLKALIEDQRKSTQNLLGEYHRVQELTATAINANTEAVHDLTVAVTKLGAHGVDEAA